MNDNKSIIESMLMSGMSMEEIYNFFSSIIDKRLLMYTILI